MSRVLLLVLGLAWVALPAQGQTTLPGHKVERVEKAVTAFMAGQSIPALSLAIVADNRVSYTNGFGMADLENFVPAKSVSIYRLGSISKAITAVAVMQLAERRKLDLDAPVQDYCPAFPRKKWKVTPRQLLGHLAGVRHYQGNEFASTRHYDNWADGLAIFKDDPLLHEPGAKYSYTTYGYGVLGCAVEGASGSELMDYFRRHIFEPSGMDRMQADDIHILIPNRVRGYKKGENGDLLNADAADTSYKIPGGGLSSTVEDLARFAIALHKGVLLSKATLRKMWTPLQTPDGKSTGYGLGFSVGQYKGYKHVGHGGGQQGTSTLLWMVPEKEFAVAIMTNLEGVDDRDKLAERIADLLLDD